MNQGWVLPGGLFELFFYQFNPVELPSLVNVCNRAKCSRVSCHVKLVVVLWSVVMSAVDRGQKH